MRTLYPDAPCRFVRWRENPLDGRGKSICALASSRCLRTGSSTIAGDVGGGSRLVMVRRAPARTARASSSRSSSPLPVDEDWRGSSARGRVRFPQSPPSRERHPLHATSRITCGLPSGRGGRCAYWAASTRQRQRWRRCSISDVATAAQMPSSSEAFSAGEARCVMWIGPVTGYARSRSRRHASPATWVSARLT